MFNLCSPQDQVSNFIVNNAYSDQTWSLRSNLEQSRNVMTKNKCKFYNLFHLRHFWLNKNAFQRLKITHYSSIICSNNLVWAINILPLS